MKNSLLSLLKNSQEYISGEEIGKTLGVSRAAIWKGIKNLRQEGYVIEAVTNKGYKLMESGDLLNPADVQMYLKTQVMGKEIFIYNEVDSTNNVLREMAFNKVAEGAVVIAHEQTQGKGRRGKAWASAKGQGLWMSVLLRPVAVLPVEGVRVTLIAGISVCQALRGLGFDASIKWPNDIIINNKKVCGILAEMNSQIDSIEFIVLGIGVNVNNQTFPKEIEDVAISLKIADGIGEKRSRVGAEILNALEKNYFAYKEKGFGAIKAVYEENCITIGKEVRVLSKEEFSGQAVGINEDGELIVQKDDGNKVIVYSGEVSVRGVL